MNNTWIVILEIEADSMDGQYKAYKAHVFTRLRGNTYDEITFRVPKFPKKKYSRKIIKELGYVMEKGYKSDVDVEFRIKVLTQREGITKIISYTEQRSK